MTGSPPLKTIKDPTLLKGERLVEQGGSPPRETSVHRTVLDPNGKLLYETTWRSYYVAEPTVVRIGTKLPPPPPKKKRPKTEVPPATEPPATETPAGSDAASEAVPPGGVLPPTTPEPPTTQRP